MTIEINECFMCNKKDVELLAASLKISMEVGNKTAVMNAGPMPVCEDCAKEGLDQLKELHNDVLEDGVDTTFETKTVT